MNGLSAIFLNGLSANALAAIAPNIIPINRTIEGRSRGFERKIIYFLQNILVYMNLEGKFLILFSNKFWIIFHISQGAFLIYTTDLNRDYFLHQVLSSPLSDSGFKFNSCHSEIMGRTVPSYRIAAEMERGKWKIFRQRLDKKDRKEFDKMFSYSRLFNSAGSNACRPQLIHPVIMSIIFEHYKELEKLRRSLAK